MANTTTENLPDCYFAFKDSVDEINKMGPMTITFPIELFKREWLGRFLNDEDNSVRDDWAKNITGSPYNRTQLIDSNNQPLVTLPAMMVSPSSYIRNDINMADFLDRYRHAKKWANGIRAFKLIDRLIERGMEHVGPNIKDLKEWVAFYDYFDTRPDWIKAVINTLHDSGISITDEKIEKGEAHNGDEESGFGSADDFQPI